MKPLRVRLAAGAAVLLVTALVGRSVHAQAPAPGLVWTVASSPGGGGSIYTTSITADRSGNVYVADNDRVSKFDRDGNVLYSVQLGGSLQETTGTLAVDAAGNLYVAGATPSPRWNDFVDPPRWTVAGDSASSNGQVRAFVMKLDPAGQVQYVHRIGGSINDIYGLPATDESIGVNARGIAVDAAGRVFVALNVLGNPAKTPPTLSGRTRVDVVVAVLDPTGQTLQRIATIVANDASYVTALALGASGELVLGGRTDATNFPVTENALDRSADLTTGPGKGTNGFLSLIDAASGALRYSTYLGGTTASDYVHSVAVDPSGDIIVGGSATSLDFPTTNGAFDRTNAGGGDAFVAKFTAGGELVYSTLIGGSGGEAWDGLGLAPTGDGAVWVASASASADFPVTPDAFDGSHNGEWDVVLTRLSADGRELEWSSYLGTPLFDMATRLALDPQGALVIAAATSGADFGFPDGERCDDCIDPSNYEDGAPVFSIVSKFIVPGAPGGGRNTPAGGAVTIDSADGGGSVTFGSVTTGGETTVVPIDASSLDLTLPGGFAISGDSQAYEVSTTATVSGITVCLSGAGLAGEAFSSAVVLHGVGGTWVAEATTRDAATGMLCATVASLSPFAVGVVADAAPPVIACGEGPTGWSNANLSLTCTAEDAGTGLANSRDASFTLATNVAADSETANASTGTRQVCDRAGNCVTAGPIGGLRIDLRAPTIQVTAPAARRYVVGEPLKAAYACTDAGAGVASCSAPVASGVVIPTTAVGSNAFAVTARDAAGNTRTASVSYSVGYGLKPLFDQTAAYRSTGAVPFAAQLVNATGVNLSSPSIVLTAVRITRLADNSVVPLNYAVPYDARSRSYGGKFDTKGLAAGTYEVALVAGSDPFVHRVRFTLK